MDRDEIIKIFIRNFVQKDKRERCYLELTDSKRRNKFVDRLNHRWDSILNMNCLTQVSNSDDHTLGIKKLLKFKDDDICYVISNYHEYDDKFLSFDLVFDQIYSRGFATILINTSGDKMFLDTEAVKGPAPRFIGHAVIQNVN